MGASHRLYGTDPQRHQKRRPIISSPSCAGESIVKKLPFASVTHKTTGECCLRSCWLAPYSSAPRPSYSAVSHPLAGNCSPFAAQGEFGSNAPRQPPQRVPAGCIGTHLRHDSARNTTRRCVEQRSEATRRDPFAGGRWGTESRLARSHRSYHTDHRTPVLAPDTRAPIRPQRRPRILHRHRVVCWLPLLSWRDERRWHSEPHEG